jgi:UDPglucose 6-dehydrogenase
MHATAHHHGTDDAAAENCSECLQPFELPMFRFPGGRRNDQVRCKQLSALKISYMNDIANLCEMVGGGASTTLPRACGTIRASAEVSQRGRRLWGQLFSEDTKALRFLAPAAWLHLRTVDAAVEITRAESPAV